MVKRADTITQRLRVSRTASNLPPPEIIRECRDFLNISLNKYIVTFDNLDNKEIITHLELVEKIARRIASAVTADKIRRDLFVQS